MDRDGRWDRIQRAYDLLVAGYAAYHAASGVEAVEAAYERGETDEFIDPTLVGEEARIRPGDRVFCFNFRPDRMREIVRALAEPGFELVDRGGVGTIDGLSTMTEYHEGWPYPVALGRRAPGDDARRGDRGHRGPPAARRRDGEVPARDVFLQRRRRGTAGGRASASSCPRRATSRPTTTSPR